MRIITACLFFWMSMVTAAWANRDSVGIRQVGGISYILHKVDKGQGIYTIAKKYKVSIAQIEQLNPEVKSGLNPEQELLIPMRKGVAMAPQKQLPSKTTFVSTKQQVEPENRSNQPWKETAQSKTPADEPDRKPVMHTVTTGETVFRIAKNHNISVDDFKKWNKMTTAGISVGQKVIVGYSGLETPVIQNRNTSKTTIEKRSVTLPDGTVLGGGPRQEEEKDKYQREQEAYQKLYAEKSKEGKVETKEVDESVPASSIDDANVEAELNLALHRSAPPGTLIRVTNPMNNKSVFVKVIGKLQDAPGEENIAIKITKTAADKLGIMDRVFRVELHYQLEIIK